MRRKVFVTKRLTITAVVVMLLAACTSTPSTDVSSTSVDTTEVTADDTTEGSVNEAPMLSELVESGDLPPLDERLPVDPMVVEPIEEVGIYGGEWRTAILGPGDHPWFGRTVGYEPLLRWNRDFTEPIANIVSGYEVNDDATEYTFTLREGLKWSDGEALTADDIVFWYEAFATNEALSPAPPGFLVTGGEVAEVEQFDDLTIRFSFPGGPNGLLLANLASGGPGAGVATMPRHYLEQFHEDYNADVADIVAEEGLDDWVQLFQEKAGILSSNVATDLPTIHPWTMQNPLGEGGTVTFERNPYYWKVDTEGNQLPYIDRVVFDVVGETDVLLLRALNGDLDMHTRHLENDLTNRPQLAESRDSGGYEFFETTSAGNNQLTINLNFTHKDEALREVFQNKDFRAGLSHAINRQEIIDAVYAGQGEPMQPAPLPGSEFFNEQLATQFTEYDPAQAEALFEQAGYGEQDSEGFRLGPDGERISFDIQVVAETQSWVDAVQLVVGYWNEVGVDVRMDAVDRSLFEERQSNNDHDALVWWGPPDGYGVIFEPYFYFPSSSGGVAAAFAKEWAWWYEGDPRGQEPPEAAQTQMGLFDQLIATADVAEQQDLMREILDIAAEEFYVMGTAPLPNGVGIVGNDFHNVPESVSQAGPASSPALSNPEQYFIRP
jgi:peptide/nickel transport system substrate-binding protein